VLVVGAAPASTVLDLGPALAAVRKLVDAGAKPRVAAGVVAELTGAGANQLYKALTDKAADPAD
jgi:16S rRNA (cytidine1402-2'-O)-methyltransferase